MTIIGTASIPEQSYSVTFEIGEARRRMLQGRACGRVAFPDIKWRLRQMAAGGWYMTEQSSEGPEVRISGWIIENVIADDWYEPAMEVGSDTGTT